MENVLFVIRMLDRRRWFVFVMNVIMVHIRVDVLFVVDLAFQTLIIVVNVQF